LDPDLNLNEDGELNSRSEFLSGIDDAAKLTAMRGGFGQKRHAQNRSAFVIKSDRAGPNRAEARSASPATISDANA
jgi:hypothetical protein